MNYSEAYRKGIGILRSANIEAPAAEAGVLLCYFAKCDRAFLYAHGDKELDGSLSDAYMRALDKRAGGYPLQYITGSQEFMSLPFEVGQGVLIPRQETEVLVETVIAFCRQKRVRILDMGTGSGCIAVSLARYLPDSSVAAADSMQDALDIARRNALSNGVADRILLIRSNLFENVRAAVHPDERFSKGYGTHEYETQELFDVIVSNPPYIRSGDIQRLQREVCTHEPLTALDGGDDGLHFYREIVKAAPLYLKEGGMLAFETGYDQAADVAELLSVPSPGVHEGVSARHSCFRDIRIYKDLAGIDRVVTGILMK